MFVTSLKIISVEITKELMTLSLISSLLRVRFRVLHVMLYFFVFVQEWHLNKGVFNCRTYTESDMK